MAVVTFKFDESYKKSRSLMVSGWVADDRQWRRLEKRWQKAIAYENRTLPDGMKIKRYHAAEMNANDGEYKGWENEKPRKLRFTKKLLKFVSNQQMTAIGCGIDLASFDELFPDRKPADYCIPYLICMQMLMVLIGEAMKDTVKPDYRVALVHDHGDWDVEALKGYNRMMDDPKFEYRERFVSITPLTWKQDIGLQAADLIAYESMRWLDDHLWTKRDIRPALRALTSMNDMVYGTWINREGLQDLRKAFEEGRFGNEYKLGVREVRQDDDQSSESSAQRDKGQA